MPQAEDTLEPVHVLKTGGRRVRVGLRSRTLAQTALPQRMMAVADHETFELGTLTLQRGLTLPKAHLAYKTYGTLAADKSNVILYPASYGAHHSDIEWLVGRQRVLDPERYFIVIPNQFGNGLSTSPSNLAEPFGLGRHPLFTHWDNVHAQARLLREKFGITRLALVYGWSMGGQQALHWGALFPERARAIVAFSGLIDEWGVTLEPAWVNGQPGFRTIAPDGRLVNVVGLDVVDGRVVAIRSMLNPHKLSHLGEVSDLGLRPSARRNVTNS